MPTLNQPALLMKGRFKVNYRHWTAVITYRIAYYASLNDIRQFVLSVFDAISFYLRHICVTA